MTARELIAELKGTVCRCGHAKTARQTFCYRCYRKLPANLQKALYKRIGEGYEKAYADSVAALDAEACS